MNQSQPGDRIAGEYTLRRVFGGEDQSHGTREKRPTLEIGKLWMSGMEGIAKAVAEAPDAILLDVMMPENDGPDVSRRARAGYSRNAVSVDSSWHRTFREMRGQFAEGAEERLAAIDGALDRLLARPEDAESLAEVRLRFHRLSGTGATFGFPRVSVLGIEGEHACDAVAEAARSPTPGEIRAWRELVEQVREAFRAEAERLMHRLLEEFSVMPRSGADRSAFHVSFSAGVAGFVKGMTVDAWRQAADDALYAAKSAGRHRVARARPEDTP